jgi:hypothetical protein
MNVKIYDDTGKLIMDIPLNKTGLNDKQEPYNFKFYFENIDVKIKKGTDL